jgi:hypothetical protein
MTIPIDGMEVIPCGETKMAERLRQLNWSKTHQFFDRAIYYNNKKEVIGVTIYQPHISPSHHTHYANRIF